MGFLSFDGFSLTDSFYYFAYISHGASWGYPRVSGEAWNVTFNFMAGSKGLAFSLCIICIILVNGILPIVKVRCKGDAKLEAPKQLCVTRRDALICLTTLSASGIGISSPKVAEARMTKDEIRRKIKEKFEMLREKAGLSRRKENDKEKSPSTPPSTKKEKSLPLEPPPLPLPNPPQGFKKSLVEVTL